jgi:Family of unknown function (DUF6662)
MSTSHLRNLSALAFTSAIIALGPAAGARADEPLFGYTYTTDLLPPGKWEIEQWATDRIQKAHGSFNLLEGRTELSYGVSDRFQLSLYANYAWTRSDHQNVDGTTSPPETFAGPLFDPNGIFKASKFSSVSVEGIYRVMSPYTDPFGLALYFEPTFGNGLRGFEERIIFQKNFLDDRLVLAFNIKIEQELRKLQGDPTADPTSDDFRTHWDRETDLNFSFGASYRFMSNWSIGLEFMNEREFSSLNFWDAKFATNSAYYIGPNIHYADKNFFFTLTLLEQLPWASDYTNPPSNVVYQGRNYADDFEKYRVRLKAGWVF